LVYAIALVLIDDTSLGGFRRRGAALFAGLAFLLHPATVETVAWASAFPYVLSLLLLLLSFFAYVNRRSTASIDFYDPLLLLRPAAIGYPIVLLVTDLCALKRLRHTSVRRLVIDKTPFVIVAALIAAAEWHARDPATLAEIGPGPRLTMAAVAPFVYLSR